VAHDVTVALEIFDNRERPKEIFTTSWIITITDILKGAVHPEIILLTYVIPMTVNKNFTIIIMNYI